MCLCSQSTTQLPSTETSFVSAVGYIRLWEEAGRRKHAGEQSFPMHIFFILLCLQVGASTEARRYTRKHSRLFQGEGELITYSQ